MNVNKTALIKLLNATSASEVASLLKEDSFFTSVKWWPIGDNESNFSIISAQQRDSVNALVEKIVNSIDALLMKKCLQLGINPEDHVHAPKSMKEAVERFFEIPKADISKLNLEKRRKLAEKIQVIAEGERNSPSIMIVDDGEGQEPNKFEKTFLSLPTSESNKLKINFVQGKFNMGGTGALMFCGDPGERRFQLILSKKDRTISDSNLWGFTLIKETYRKDAKNVKYPFFRQSFCS